MAHAGRATMGRHLWLQNNQARARVAEVELPWNSFCADPPLQGPYCAKTPHQQLELRA